MSALLAALMAFDEAPILITDRIAFDRAGTSRRIDVDGRMHVEVCNISKANVCPYKGKEIPGYQRLGLDPAKVYKMFRAPEELSKPETVRSANGIQLMSKHIKVTAADPKEHEVAGTTGTDAAFDAPYLRNSIVIWRQEDIDDVVSQDRCELSCAYHYEPDMTSGTWEGEGYDGVMREIIFNHVALVEEGRAGPDVVVADSKEITDMNIGALATRAMSMTALASFLKPRLVEGTKVDLSMAFDGIPVGPGFDSALLAKRLGKQVKGKLAKDASMGQIAELLDMIDSHEGTVEKDESVSKEQHGAMEAAAHGQSNLGIPQKVGEEFSKADKGKKFGDAARDWLRGKGMSDDDITELEGMDEEEEPDKDQPGVENERLNGKGDEPPPFKGKPEVGGGKDKAARDKAAKDKAAKDAKDKAAKDAAEAAEKEKEDMVTKGAMDAAIAAVRKQTLAEVSKTQREIREAEKDVRPLVGEIDTVFDSAADVYKAALEARGVDIEGVPPAAYRAMVKMLPKAGAEPKGAGEKRVAMDAAATKNFDDMFPGAAGIRVTA